MNGNAVTAFDFKRPGDVYFKMHNVELAVGDVVVISGQSICTNDKTKDGIKLTAPATYIWNGTVWTVEEDAVKLEGATIKTETDVSKQGMRYEVSLDADKLANAKEVGLLLLPSALLAGNELTVNSIGVLKIATVVGDANWNTVMAEGGFQAVLTNATINGRQNLQIVSRVYWVLEDNTVEYGEVSSRSLTSVAQAIAQTAIGNGAVASAEVTALLAKAQLDDNEIAAVISFCRDNIDYL